MTQLKVGVIGCGGVAKVHIQALQQLEDVEIYSVCDLKDEIETLATQLGCKYYKEYKEMLKDEALEAVHICTPHYLHVPMATEAIKQGKHVFMEKPMGMTVSECESLAQLAEETNQKVGICLQNRFNATSQAMKAYIEEGSLGQMKGIRAFVSWCRKPEYYQGSDWRGRKQYEGGGLLMNQMVHTLDLMQWYCEGVAALEGQVSTRLLGEVIDEEDTAEATFWMNNGAIGHFYATNTYTANSSVFIEMDFEKGLLRDYEGRLTLVRNQEETILVENKKAEGEKDYWGKAHAIAIEKFYQAIRGEESTYIPVKEGIESVQMAQGIYQSSEERKKITIR